MIRPVFAGLGLCANLGCLIWPFPTGDLLEGRGRIQREYTAPLVIGTSTRADVLLRLGEPDQVQSEGRIFLYRWTEVRGFFALAAYGNGVVIPFPGHRDVRIEFDAEGRVASITFQSRSRTPQVDLDPATGS